MADFDGFLVSTTSPFSSDAETHAPIVDGDIWNLKSFSSAAQAFFLPDVGGCVTYRMRGIDGDLGYPVYWESLGIDKLGVDYPGNSGALSDVVVSEVIGLP
jgi:hypothetical protein